ncbi:hypothetical protein RI367_008349 [Sorochytrium milnesiophthora]
MYRSSIDMCDMVLLCRNPNAPAQPALSMRTKEILPEDTAEHRLLAAMDDMTWQVDILPTVPVLVF